jgi:hypothetical protein
VTNPDISQHAEQERRLVPPEQHRVPLEDPRFYPPSEDSGSDQGRLRPAGTLSEHGRGVTPLTDHSMEPAGSARKSATAPDRPASSGATPSSTPRVSHTGSGNHPEPGPQEPPAPAIRVSIGRIEVRATMPPPPMPAAQPAVSARPGPALSLDDYLKQRSGRRR